MISSHTHTEAVRVLSQTFDTVYLGFLEQNLVSLSDEYQQEMRDLVLPEALTYLEKESEKECEDCMSYVSRHGNDVVSTMLAIHLRQHIEA